MVGLSLCAQLGASGEEVVATWHSNMPSAISRTRLGSTRWQKFPTDRAGWSSLLGEADTVFHLANKLWNFSQISANPNGPSAEEPKKNRTILDASLYFGVKKFVWLSSSIGYGAGSTKKEDDFFSGTVEEPYGAFAGCVREFETLLGREYPQLDIRIFRPTTIIGPPARRPSNQSHIFIRILEELIDRGKTTVFSPDPKRNFLFVDDLARLFREEASLVPEPGKSEAYNLRSNNNWSLSELAEEATHQLGLDSSSVEVSQTDRTPLVLDLPATKLRQRHQLPSSELEDVVSATLDRLLELRGE